jgi:adenylate cyclase
LRVNAQLVSTDTGLHVWADRFDIDPEAGAMQSDVIAARLATTLGTQVIQEASAQTRSNNPDASDLILRARSLLTQPASMQREEAARVLFEHALQLDPSSGYAMARCCRRTGFDA